ncbi:unnamed protein product [Prunus armeniaca]
MRRLMQSNASPFASLRKWSSEKNGKYSVRSGYHNIHTSHQQTSLRRPSPSILIDSKVWKLIWHADVPPKVLHFLWKALNGHIAVSSVLQKKKLRPSPLCPICNDEEESIERMRFLCPWVEPIWFGGILNYRIDKHGISTLHQWLRDCVTVGLNTKEERNRHKIAHPTSGNNRQTPQARWITPPTSLAKINVEAAWHHGSCRAGAGIIIRNSEGSFRGAKSISFHVETALDAEAVALLEGCKFAKEQNFTKVCFESDSLELIKYVKGNISRGRWNLYPVFTLIREEQRRFEGCSWNWTNKIDNQAANNLVSLALSRMSKGVWVERPPHFSCAHSKQGRPSLPSSLLSGLPLV